jgi:hypothetical protein
MAAGQGVLGSVGEVGLIGEEVRERDFRIANRVRMTKEPSGYRVEPSGKLVLVDLPEEIVAERQSKWIALLDHIESTPRDPDFMKERPMNQPPVDRNLLSDG